MTDVFTEIVQPPLWSTGITSVQGLVYVFSGSSPSYKIGFAYIPLETQCSYPSPNPELAFAASTIAVIRPAKASNPSKANNHGAQHVLLSFSVSLGGLTGSLQLEQQFFQELLTVSTIGSSSYIRFTSVLLQGSATFIKNIKYMRSYYPGLLYNPWLNYLLPRLRLMDNSQRPCLYMLNWELLYIGDRSMLVDSCGDSEQWWRGRSDRRGNHLIHGDRSNIRMNQLSLLRVPELGFVLRLVDEIGIACDSFVSEIGIIGY